MDAEQMRRWLTQLGLPCEIRRVELEIQGERNAQRVQGSLEKAGFAVLVYGIGINIDRDLVF